MKNKICRIGISIAIFSSILIATVANKAYATNYSYTTPQAAYNSTQNNSLQGRVTFVPAGAITTVMISSGLNSENLTMGSTIKVNLVEDFIYQDKIIAQKGSVINGVVIKAKKAGFGNRNAQIQVIFNEIQTPQGYNIPINAVFKTDDNTGILKGGTKLESAKEYAKNTTIGAASGAVLGTAMGALSDGSVGKGAIYGTAIGGGLGLIKGAANKGEDINIPTGAYMDIFFTQPITLSAPTEYKYDY